MIEICHQWAKRFITLFGKYQKNSWNWFLFFPNLFGVYTFMKIYIFPNQNLYLEYRYAALNNIAIDLICRFLLGRPIPRAAFYICSMYKWLTSSVSDGSINQIRFFIFFFVKLIWRLFWPLGKHLFEFFPWNQKLVIRLRHHYVACTRVPFLSQKKARGCWNNGIIKEARELLCSLMKGWGCDVSPLVHPAFLAAKSHWSRSQWLVRNKRFMLNEMPI